MITKAIVDKVINKYQIRVRVPTIDRVSYDSISTTSDQLSIATICTLPHFIPNVKVGDIVFVSFEDDLKSKPVIIGYLYMEKDYETYVDGIFSSIVVNNNAKLSQDTTIGEIDYNQLKQLKGINGNIQLQLNSLKSQAQQSGIVEFPCLNKDLRENQACLFCTVENTGYVRTLEFGSEFIAGVIVSDKGNTALVGICGIYNVIDDGRCKNLTFCDPDAGGKAKPGTKYKIIKRVDENTIQILFK